MDLNFGEINEPISRAFHDDYEFNFNQFNRPEVIWKTDDENDRNPVEIENFVIVEGINARKLLKDTILQNGSKLICSINQNVEVYLMGNSTVLCVAEESELNYYATISDHLEPWIKVAKNCSIISLQRLSDYKTDKLPEDCVIRGINSLFDDIEPLGAPNFITGISAGVSTKRLLNESPFSCYIFYVDLFDEVAIKKILGHLKRTGLAYDENVKIKPLHYKSDLYM